MKVKKLIISILTFCLLLSCSTISTLANEPTVTSVFVENAIEGYKDDEITVPINIENNMGIMGYKINVEYNNQELEILSVENGLSSSSNFNDSIDGNTGKFYVLWNSTQNITENGCMFKIKFKVLSDEDTISEIRINYSQADTFNEAFKDVILDCSNGFVVLNSSDHIFVPKEVAPTCTTEGYTIYECGDCGKDYTINYINPIGHNIALREATTPTCSKSGNYSYYYCSVCGKYFDDSEGTNEISVDSKTIPATGNHIPDKGTISKKATYTETGVKVYKCTACGEVIKTEIIAKLVKKANTLTVKAKKPTVKYSKLKKKNQTIALKKAMTVTKAQGAVTYKLSSAKKGKKKFKKYFKVAKNGKITVKKGLKKGTYTVKIKVSAAGNNEYNAAVKTVTVKIKVK